MLDKDPDQKKTVRQNIEVLIHGIKTADTKFIACKAIISQNYASDFIGACYIFSDQVLWLHVSSQMEAQR